MKLVLLITSSCLLVTCYFANAQRACCTKPAKGPFAMWVEKEGFHAAHTKPEPLQYQASAGSMIQFATPDGGKANAFAVLSGAKNGKVLILLHEWWGLNDYIKREAETIATELGAVDVYALDLYDGKVAANADEAGALMSGLNPARATAIVKGLYALVGPKAQVATLGWCMGGSWSFQAALLGGTQVKACVMYYGFPETDKKKIKQLQSDVLYISAEQDAFITKEAREQFYTDLRSLNKQIRVKKYDAVHAFANPSNPKYDKAFADDAHLQVLDYIFKRLELK